MYKVAIIGVGALGKRHLESVLKSPLPLEVYAVDNNPEMLEAVLKANPNRVIGGCDVTILPKEIDVAVIATSSAVRKDVFEALIGLCQVKNIIFEKVLFQRVKDYYEVERQLENLGIAAWVNCARREYDSYKKIKYMVDSCRVFTFHASGGEWGLGCNGIHILDLIQYLSGSTECNLEEFHLLPEIVDSKRKGYKEIFGTLTGKCGKCEAFSVSCIKDSTLPFSIEISADNFRCTILEGSKKMLLMRKDNDWKMEEKDFAMFYQSQLTQRVVENILNEGSCNLPQYKESMKLHLAYIEPLIKFFEKQGMEKEICPIT